MNNTSELLFVLAMFEGAKIYKKLPKFLTDELTAYMDRYGYENYTQAIEGIKLNLKK